MEIRDRDIGLLVGAVLFVLALLQLFRQRVPRITVSLDEGVERYHTILMTSFNCKISHALKGGFVAEAIANAADVICRPWE